MAVQAGGSFSKYLFPVKSIRGHAGLQVYLDLLHVNRQRRQLGSGSVFERVRHMWVCNAPPNPTPDKVYFMLNQPFELLSSL